MQELTETQMGRKGDAALAEVPFL